MAEENTNINSELNDEGQEKDTFTKDEVMQMIQRESDRRVTQALKKQQKSFDQKLSLSQLDEESREKAMKDNRIAELEEQLRELNALQTKAEVIKTISARGLSPQFADLINIGEDVDEAQEKIEQLDKLFKSAVAEEIKKRLAGETPKSGSDNSQTITKEQFRKMTLAQQSKLYQENPELYNQLIK